MEGRKLSQGAVDGFWVLLVFGLLLFNPFDFGQNGSQINLAIYDIVLPLIFLVAVVQGQIVWPKRKAALLFFIPWLLVVFHSVLTAVLVERTDLSPLFAGALRQTAFFFDIGMLVLLFQSPERRQPSRGALIFLIFAVTTYALTMRYLEEQIPNWPTYETIYAAIITGLLLLFFFLRSSEEKPEGFFKIVALIAWALTALLLLFTKLFVLIGFLIATLFFVEEFRKFEGRRAGQFLRGMGLFAVLVTVFVVVLVEIDVGRYFIRTYGSFASEIARSLDIRLQLWSFAWQFALEAFPWGIGLNQFGGYVAEAASSKALHVASVHNTPLRLLMELGILGIGIFGVVVALVVYSGRGLGPYQRTMLYLYIFMPMLLHDALGLRIFHIGLAFCLAMALFPAGPAPKERRSP
ncbi:MAG: hypothetical protein J4G10_01440 [Alphaproteobacteria bacterium]|nr:hypothetical protein [Alphaproteobacteria bacterium]